MLANGFIVLGQWGNRWKVASLAHNKHLINYRFEKNTTNKQIGLNKENLASFGLPKYLWCLRENLIACLELRFSIKVDSLGLIELILIGINLSW